MRDDAEAGGDADTVANLLPLVYEELRHLARARLAELAPGQTLQATALVHEVYLRLAHNHLDWQGTRHFFFAAARAMHDIIVEHARQKASLKRGGDCRRLDLDRLTMAHDAPAPELLALAEAMTELQRRDPGKHQLVLLRFFAGCTLQETATAMELPLRSVERQWRYARLWLHKRLTDLPD